jgi:hypothetical protein
LAIELLVQWFGCTPVEPNHFERDNRTAPPFLPSRFAPGHANFPPFPTVLVQFARVFQSATGIIVFSQVAIATSDDTEELMYYVEALWFVLGQI